MARPACLLAAACLIAGALGAPARAASPLPAGWPAHLALGLSDAEGGAADLRASAPLEVRYHYLAGGANTGRGWTTWARGAGTFAGDYVADSQASGFLPVFTLYQLRQSLPGAALGDEGAADLRNLATRATMRAFFSDLRTFFERVAGRGPVVLHVEPDLWGYVQRAGGDDAARVPAQVAATGLPELAGLPNTAAGLARGVVRLRDRLAPNVQLGYHVSVWGTGEDIAASDPTEQHVDELAGRAAAFYRSLGAPFDLLFAEFADRDAGYAEKVDHNPAAWWDAGDFARHARFLGDLSSQLERRVVLWQIPLGNTVMRSMDDTPGHYRDNRVEWLLGPDSTAHLRPYVSAGVIALLFGPALPGATCACDAARDGVTNPLAPTAGLLTALSPDDDGGYFRARARAYYAAGAPALPSAGASRPSPARRRRRVPRLRVVATASRAEVRRGRPIDLTVRVVSGGPTVGVVALQLFAPGARSPIFQEPWRNQRFRARVPRRFRARFVVPADAPPGSWTVKVGVWDADWARLYRWSERAAKFTVR